MISFGDLLEMKNKAEQCGDKPHSVVCHSDNLELIYTCLEDESGKKLSRAKVPRIFGMPILALPFCPKDKIYMLSKNMVDHIKESIGIMLLGKY